MQYSFHLINNLYTIRCTFLFNYTYVGIRLLKPYGLSPGPQLVEVPGNADFTKGQFWPVCPCVTNVKLTTPALLK